MSSVAFPFSATGAVGTSSAAYTTIHGLILTETGGTTNATVTLKDQGSSSGTVLATIIVPKGTTLPVFQSARFRIVGTPYFTVSGGTLAGTAILS